ncbi:MAG: signal peptide peptidase SppA [Pseudomonadota bacterium]
MSNHNSAEPGSRMTVWSFFRGFAKVLIGGALLIQAFLFIILFTVVISVFGALSSSEVSNGREGPSVKIPSGASLLFNPQGLLAETEPVQDPFDQAIGEIFGGGNDGKVSVHKLVQVIEEAAEDDRIQSMVLDLDRLIIPSSYLSKAHLLADAVETFRESGKEVVAVGDFYGQAQYLVASEADQVLMHDYGAVIFPGFGRYRTYYASLLDNLDVTRNVFRAGSFKSALEPYFRDDMSPEAKEANLAYLSVMWDSVASRIDENRGLGDGATQGFSDQLPEFVRAARGDLALTALESGYIDEIGSRVERRAFLVDLVGENSEGELNVVDLDTYRSGIDEPIDRSDVANVMVIPVEGAIVMGDNDLANASGEVIAKRIRQAREDDDVAAVVLRVDSPGGALFAAQLMHEELVALKEAGKPLVASMSSFAASGGYWISAPADKIFAAETTITGSIGVYSFIPTFENLADRYGVSVDGVGTTPLSALDAAGIGGLPESFSEIVQYSVEEAYRDFLQTVSEGRGTLTPEEVNERGQGRVWIGTQALELGLVDEIGGLDDAVDAAAELAGLEDFDVVGASREKSQFELFLESFGADTALRAALPTDVLGLGKLEQTSVGRAAQVAHRELMIEVTHDDPNGVYIRCLPCEDF